MSTALYRRYRPESFADVIGQEHVTEPLMQALRSGRVNHAYLFSGPRGCGKTTSARILARCLNCEEGPTPEPCGTCDSCVALARDGAGSVDVIEIDAASHGGVDDARDLRERAAFGPAQSRYKVYIIDEAHMVTPNGFNALLKVVEEPPPHVKFIFATTEPEKVLATIRSRTHHYPFHLVPPQRLTGYLEQVCEREGVSLEPGVLSFVTRAGGGSVRDSLSVLDQLISGAGAEGLTYERTAALLGFTDVELLDAVVDAVAAGDAATVFAQVDKVMSSGHDPRRFVEDLLERYRDLIVLAAVGDSAAAAGLLPGLPADQIERMRHQAAVQGPEALSRAADIISRGLSEMGGAVSTRLLLELLVARLLLPAASGEEGYGARLDRIERRLTAADGSAAPAAAGPAATSRPQVQQTRPAAPQPAPTSQPAPAGQPAHARQPAPAQGGQAPQGGPGPQGGQAPQGAAAPAGRPAAPESPTPAQGPAAGPGAAQGAPQPAGQGPAAQQQPAAPGALDTAALRRQWPDVLERVKEISRRTWSGLQMAVLLDYDGRRVLLGMPDENWIRHFIGTQHSEALRQALIEAIALDTRIEAVVAGPGGSAGGQAPPSGPAGPTGPGGPARPSGAPSGGAPAPSGPAPTGPSAGPAPTGTSSGPGPAGPAPGGRPSAGPSPTGPVAAVVPDSPAPTAAEPPAGPPQWQPPSGDGPPPGVRIRTRANPSGVAAAPGPRPPAPTRPVAPTTGAPGPATGAPSSGSPAGPEPSMADQLGAGRRAPAAADGPDWSQQTRSTAAPAWASAAPGDAPAPQPSGPRSPQAPPQATAPQGGSGYGDAPSDDDEDLASSGVVGQPVIEQVLGGTVIAINDDIVG